jgi:hypothetical protein
MNEFLARAKGLLHIAATGGSATVGSFVLIDRCGGMRIIRSDGWSMAGAIQEFGAAEIFHIQRSANAIKVDGWSPVAECTLSSQDAQPGTVVQGRHASMLQLAPRQTVWSNEKDPEVRNS